MEHDADEVRIDMNSRCWAAGRGVFRQADSGSSRGGISYGARNSPAAYDDGSCETDRRRNEARSRAAGEKS